MDTEQFAEILMDRFPDILAEIHNEVIKILKDCGYLCRDNLQVK